MNEVNNGPLSCTQNTALWQSGIEGSRKRLICSRQHQGLSVSYPALQKGASIKEAVVLSSALVESVANFVGKCHILTYVLTCSLTSRLFLLQYIQKQSPVGIFAQNVCCLFWWMGHFIQLNDPQAKCVVKRHIAAKHRKIDLFVSPNDEIILRKYCRVSFFLRIPLYNIWMSCTAI